MTAMADQQSVRSGTLRGTLIECVVTEIVRQLEPPAEVDVVLIVKSRYIRFIECKGSRRSISRNPFDFDDIST